jgi:hypothetical protein
MSIDLKYKGYCYEVIIKPGRRRKYEVIKWKTGFRNLWERISYNQFINIKNEAHKV